MQQVPTEFWMWVGQVLLSGMRHRAEGFLPDASGMSGAEGIPCSMTLRLTHRGVLWELDFLFVTDRP